jgi:hypothetical protein
MMEATVNQHESTAISDARKIRARLAGNFPPGTRVMTHNGRSRLALWEEPYVLWRGGRSVNPGERATVIATVFDCAGDECSHHPWVMLLTDSGTFGWVVCSFDHLIILFPTGE